MNIAKLPMPLLSIHSAGGTHDLGTLFSVNLLTGVRNVVSDFGNSHQGVAIARPVRATWLPADLLRKLPASVLTTTRKGGTGNKPTLSMIHPETGHRRVLSDFGNPRHGVLNLLPAAVATLPAIPGARDQGRALVMAYDINDATPDKIFSVNAAGQRRLLATLGYDALEGPWDASAMAYLPAAQGSEDALIVGGIYRTGSRAAVLVRVDPDDGSISPLSHLADPGQGWHSAPAGDNDTPLMINVTVSPERAIYALVANEDAVNATGLPEPYAVILHIDPHTGQRQIISNLLDPTQGPLSDTPTALTWLPYDRLALCDSSAGVNRGGAIFLVDPSTGKRDLLSNLGLEDQGPAGGFPTDLVMTQ